MIDWNDDVSIEENFKETILQLFGIEDVNELDEFELYDILSDGLYLYNFISK